MLCCVLAYVYLQCKQIKMSFHFCFCRCYDEYSKEGINNQLHKKEKKLKWLHHQDSCSMLTVICHGNWLSRWHAPCYCFVYLAIILWRLCQFFFKIPFSQNTIWLQYSMFIGLTHRYVRHFQIQIPLCNRRMETTQMQSSRMILALRGCK